MAWVISPGADGWVYFTKGQIAWSNLSRGRWLGEFHQGADSLDHLARGQIAGGFSPGAKYLGASYQGIDG